MEMNSQPIFQYRKKAKPFLMRRWDSIVHASEKLNIDSNDIARSCLAFSEGDPLYIGEFCFKYVEELGNPVKDKLELTAPEEPVIEEPVIEEPVPEVEELKAVYQYDLQGGFLKKWESVEEAASALIVSSELISLGISKQKEGVYTPIQKFLWADIHLDKLDVKNKDVKKYLYTKENKRPYTDRKSNFTEIKNNFGDKLSHNPVYRFDDSGKAVKTYSNYWAVYKDLRSISKSIDRVRLFRAIQNNSEYKGSTWSFLPSLPNSSILRRIDDVSKDVSKPAEPQRPAQVIY